MCNTQLHTPHCSLFSAQKENAADELLFEYLGANLDAAFIFLHSMTDQKRKKHQEHMEFLLPPRVNKSKLSKWNCCSTIIWEHKPTTFKITCPSFVTTSGFYCWQLFGTLTTRRTGCMSKSISSTTFCLRLNRTLRGQTRESCSTWLW